MKNYSWSQPRVPQPRNKSYSMFDHVGNMRSERGFIFSWIVVKWTSLVMDQTSLEGRYWRIVLWNSSYNIDQNPTSGLNGSGISPVKLDHNLLSSEKKKIKFIVLL